MLTTQIKPRSLMVYTHRLCMVSGGFHDMNGVPYCNQHWYLLVSNSPPPNPPFSSCPSRSFSALDPISGVNYLVHDVQNVGSRSSIRFEYRTQRENERENGGGRRGGGGRLRSP